MKFIERHYVLVSNDKQETESKVRALERLPRRETGGEECTEYLGGPVQEVQCSTDRGFRKRRQK